MRKFTAFLSSVSLFFLPALSVGQNFAGGFFLDNYDFSYRINPAFSPSAEVSGLFGLFVDDINVGASSNFGISSLYFPLDGKLVSGLDKRISPEQFPGSLNDINTFGADINLNLLTLGLRATERCFFTFEMNARSNEYLSVPRSFFEYLKIGGAAASGGKMFDIGSVTGQSSNAVELALGLSLGFGDKVKIGARAKLELGLAYAGMDVNNLKMVIPDSFPGELAISGEGKLNAAAGISVGKNEDGNIDFNSISYNKFKIAGKGFAFDLGASFKPADNLEISLAMQDLGFINWNDIITAGMVGSKVSLEEADDIQDIDKVFRFRMEDGESKGFKETISPTVRVGARCRMSFYSPLSVGLLGSFKGGPDPYTDLRIGIGITPVRQISMTANAGFSNYGTSFGAALNLNLGPFDLFFGADSLLMDLTSRHLPAEAFNTLITAGLVFQVKS